MKSSVAISNIIVNIVPVDGLALIGARASAGTVKTKTLYIYGTGT